MVHKSNSDNHLVDETHKFTTSVKPDKSSIQKSDVLQNHVSKMDSVVRQLGNSLLESQQNDRQLLLSLQRDNVTNQKLSYQLEEARKENKQLLNVLQQQNSDHDLSRSSSRSQADVSSYSTISIVHLQYKYEELLSSHEGLLKVLESKVKECQKSYKENEAVCDELQNLILQISNCEKTINTLCEKYLNLKQRKDAKITALRYERDTLTLAHNQVVTLLHKKCMDDDNALSEELQKSAEPMKSLLIKEIRRTNKLQHENSRFQQENAFLKSRLNAIENMKRNSTSNVINSDQ